MGDITLTTGTKVGLRELGPGDEPALTAFYRGLSDAVALFFQPFLTFDAETAAGVVARRLEGREWHLVLDNGEAIVGHCFLWGMDTEEPEIGIGITEAYQNQGLGHVMMHELIDRARVAAKSSVRLTVFVENERGRHLYEGLGFVERGRREIIRSDRFAGRRMTLIEMALQLPKEALP